MLKIKYHYTARTSKFIHCLFHTNIWHTAKLKPSTESISCVAVWRKHSH